MKRRQFLAAGTLNLSLPIAGCLDGTGQTNEAQGEGETPTDDEEVSPPGQDVTSPTNPGGPVLTAWWVEQAPDEGDVYPSDEPPVSGREVLLDLFDTAVEKEPAGETEYGAEHGEGVYEYPSEETYEELSSMREEIETPDGSPYRYLDYNNTTVRLLMTIDD